MDLISYSDESFRKAQRTQGLKALMLGFRTIRLFQESDLSDEFRMKNQDSLSYSRGVGYWVWKPEIIRISIQSSTGEPSLYLDSGIIIKEQAEAFEDLASDGKIHVWKLVGQKAHHWTHPLVFEKLTWAKKFRESPMIDAGAILFSDNQITIEFLNIWSSLCGDPELLHPETGIETIGSSDFFWHRHDQSLLSLVVARNPEWFEVHESIPSRHAWERYFFRHRNRHLRGFLLVVTGENVKSMRSKALRLVPKKMRSKLIVMYNKKQKPYLTKTELDSLSKNYY
jgi:hypothetical protein